VSPVLPPVRAIGVDACKRGWVGFTSDGRGYFDATVRALIESADADGRVGVVAIDIPIGLPTERARLADTAARRLVGRRAASVFPTPVRQALTAATYREASALNIEVTGKGLSRQAYGLRNKILEVDAWVRDSERNVIEIHPEVCFATLAGRPLAHSKASWAGVEERKRILATAAIRIPADIGIVGEMAAVDDVLDAAAASWTAARYAVGQAVSHPEPPEEFGDGIAAAIWV
jgi:predicted RNase H-like nuclease